MGDRGPLRTPLAGPTPDALQPVADADRAGFETELRARTNVSWVAVRADDGATSRPVRVD